MGRGDGQKPGDVRPTSPTQAASQQLLTRMAKGRGTNGPEGKIPDAQSKKMRQDLQLWVWMEGREQNISGTRCPTRQSGTHQVPLCFPTALAFPVPPRSQHSHPGLMQETWVRDSPRAEMILPPAQPPSVLCRALTQRVAKSQLGMSHGTCRKLELSVEVVVV